MKTFLVGADVDEDVDAGAPDTSVSGVQRFMV
jgi:hypothetical protein